MIPFNKPYLSGHELKYIRKAVKLGQISGNGYFTKKCHSYFEDKFEDARVFLTTSGTSAFEMAVLLSGIGAGDEVIIPSFTFVSVPNTFLMRGAKVIFSDSSPNHPNMDVDKLEELITNKTKAIVAFHYGGVASDMDKLRNIAHNRNILLFEDAAHSFDSFYKNQPLGTLSDFGVFSFHETKNIQCGEGGMLVVNNSKYFDRAEIVWEKGTNRAAFFRGEVAKYEWMDLGGSYLPSELNAAYLFAQLESARAIQEIRLKIWEYYYSCFEKLQNEGFITLPKLPSYASNNAHLFSILCKTASDRERLIQHLKEDGIQAVFHYLPLHLSPYFKQLHDGRVLQSAVDFAEHLVRLPLFAGMEINDAKHVSHSVAKFYSR